MRPLAAKKPVSGGSLTADGGGSDAAGAAAVGDDDEPRPRQKRSLDDVQCAGTTT